VIHAIRGAHAGTNSGFLSGLDFFHDVGIGYVRPRHANHVDDSLTDSMARGCRVVDATSVKYGQCQLAAKLFYQVKIWRHRRPHAGHQVHIVYFLIHSPEVEIEKVDQAGLLVNLGYFKTIIFRKAAVEILGHARAHADDEVISHLAANFFENHQSEPKAIFKRTPEFVGSPIGLRRPELFQDVRLSNDFNAIQAAFPATQRGFAIRLDDAVDIITVHDLGEISPNLAAARGRDYW